MLQCTDLFSSQRKKMLHVAPETCLTKIFQTCPSIDYVTADLRPYAMLQMDLTQIPFPTETFDVIHASHILEHISADRQAMCELFRVLKRGGWAVLQVPIKAEITFEDATIIDSQAREQAFGHKDHVRFYGKDYYSRLSEAGFIVKPKKLPAQLNPATARKFSLNSHEDIAFCTKF